MNGSSLVYQTSQPGCTSVCQYLLQARQMPPWHLSGLLWTWQYGTIVTGITQMAVSHEYAKLKCLQIWWQLNYKTLSVSIPWHRGQTDWFQKCASYLMHSRHNLKMHKCTMHQKVMLQWKYTPWIFYKDLILHPQTQLLCQQRTGHEAHPSGHSETYSSQDTSDIFPSITWKTVHQQTQEQAVTNRKQP